MEAAVWAADNGYGSVCLQAEERRDEKFIEFICECLREIHLRTKRPMLPKGVGVTLSPGRSAGRNLSPLGKGLRESGVDPLPGALRNFESGAFQSAALNPRHQRKESEHRFECLRSLRRAGYQLGTGVMIGIPGQTLEDLCRDIRTFQKLDVDMIGMGPYLKCEGNDLESLGQMEPKALFAACAQYDRRDASRHGADQYCRRHGASGHP